jgi:hypothetical protein
MAARRGGHEQASRTFAINAAWLELALTGVDLLA